MRLALEKYFFIFFKYTELETERASDDEIETMI